jgi:serine/threonine-protein kinase
MTPENREKLQPLFERALELKSEERAAFIESVALGDRELGFELGELVRAHEESTCSLDPRFLKLQDALESHCFSEGEVVLDRFRIVRFIGRGGMGEVYEAFDTQLGRVALKTIRPDLALDEQVMQRFRLEVQLARKITSPLVCRVHELFTVPAGPGRRPLAFLTMEYLDGITLADRIRRDGRLEVKEAESIALQLCSALESIHSVGVVHRDLKPGNIMLVGGAGAVRVVVMDLGLARYVEGARAAAAAAAASGMTMPGVVLGTPEFMAPEQFEGGSITAAADIYAFGLVFYSMLTGQRPFQAASPIATAVRRARRLPPASSIRSGIPDHWDEVIDRCLEYEPASRFKSAAAVASELQRRPFWIRASGRARRQWRIIVLIGLAVAAALLSLFAWWYVASSGVHLQQRHLAVLPFEDLSQDPVDQAFCAGLTEVLVSQLAELERFQGSVLVIPSSEVRHQRVSTAQEAYRLWHVSFVMTGSVQRSNRSLRLIVNLIDARTVRQLRSTVILVPESEPVAMQNGVVSQVADLLDLQLQPQARSLLLAGATTVPGAYDYYLQGYGYLRQYSGSESIDRAIREFEHALSLDPAYALAHAGLGEAYWRKYLLTKDRDLMDKAWASCRNALRLNNGIGAAHYTLGLLYAGKGDYEGALGEYRRVLSIDPFSHDAFSGLAGAYEKMGKVNQAEATYKQAIALRPDYWNGYVRLASFYKRHGRYQDALPPLQRVTELVPDNPVGHYDLGGVYQLLGRDDLAESEYKESLKSPTASAYSNLATICFYKSRYAEAAESYAQAVKLAPANSDYWGNLGDAYRYLGDKAKAQQAYLKAIALCHEALKVNKTDATVMSSLASYLAKSGARGPAVELARNTVEHADGDSDVLYDLALTFELAGKRAEALKTLKEAVAHGYSSSIVLKEPDLAGLRADPGFEGILKR